jgi:hypothetical protein
LARVAGLTLALGLTVVVSWTAIRGLSVFTGPGPFLDPSWYLIWAIQAGLAGVVGLVAGRTWGRETPGGSLVGLVMMAWAGELLVLTLLTPLLAGDGDLRPFHAPWVWLVATGGLVQPFAAALGTVVGRERARAVSASPTG